MDSNISKNDHYPQVFWRPYLWVVLFYAVLVLVFCYPVLQGKIITQTDYLHFISPWDIDRPTALDEPSNTHLQDQSLEFLPFFMAAKEQLAAGEFPLWNPYIFTGTPLWANTQSALFYPLNLFHYVLPPPLGFTVSSLLKLLMGCVLMHLFLRQLGLTHWAALFGGLGFGFCAFTVFWLNHPHSNVTTLIPLCFLVTERLVRQPGLKAVMWCALVVALTLYGGHVEIAFIAACACGLYFLLRLIQTQALSIRALAQFLGAYVFALLLAAALVLPFIEFLFHTAIWDERGSSEPFSIPFAGWLNLLIPDLFILDGWQQNTVGYHAFSPYVGALVWPLVFMACRRNWQQAWPFLLIVLLSLAIAFSVNPVHWLVSQLPLFSHLPLFYFNVIVAFATLVLAALGLQACIDRKPTRSEALWIFAGIALALWVSLGWYPGGLATNLVDVAAFLQSLQEKIWWPFLWLLVTLLILRWIQRPQWVAVSLALMLFADLWLQGHQWNPTVDPDQALPMDTEPIQFLTAQPGPYRIVAYDRILKPSSNMLAGLHDVRGYDVPVIDRYHRFFNEALKGKDAFWYYDLPKFDASILPYLDMLNVQYLLSKKDLSAQLPEHIEPVYQGEIDIYRNHQATGLAYFPTKLQAVESKAQALAAILSWSASDSPATVIEASDDTIIEQGNDVAGTVSYDDVSAAKIRLSVDVDKPAWLVLGISHYPGWVAQVGGEETEIFAANYVQQAIKIPAGTHQVVFQYKPWSFTLGWLLSLFSLSVAIWVIRKTK